MKRQPLRLAILEATRTLEAAGVESARADAELIAAHVLDTERGRLALVPLVDPPVVEAINALVAQRAKRVPLQHLLGHTTMGAVTVEVGAGVFVPRPETELLFEWGVGLLEDRRYPVVVDLCTGSGVLALALAHERPDAVVYALDNDPDALAWARHNADTRAQAGDTPVRLYSGDVGDDTVFAELSGLVDLVLCNPPYVPQGTPVPPEVADFDPPQAVFATGGGLDVLADVAGLAARLLRPGGGVAVEHDDSHARSVAALFEAYPVLTDVTGHTDLAGRPRFVSARRV